MYYKVLVNIAYLDVVDLENFICSNYTHVRYLICIALGQMVALSFLGM